ncbi:MAG: hypothetical protein NC217_02880 [Muribaculaceae bacterium]|nr:hypothetical protein [Muribaculaceae bacterium]
MKKLLWIVSVALVALVACNKQAEHKDSSDGQQPNLEGRLAVAEDSKDSLIFLMSDIYSGIEEINMQEKLIYDLRGSDNESQRSEALANLNAIKERLAERQAVLESLSAKFNDTNTKNEALAQEVQKLKALIETQTQRIGTLEQQLQEAHAQIANLKDTVAITRQQVNDVTAEKELVQKVADEQLQANENLKTQANQVYYYIGTKKELQKAGLMDGKKANYSNLGIFKQVDKTQIKTIPLYNKKFEFVGAAPAASSYQITGDKKEPKTIVITNPDLFWANKYLIIKVG